MSEVNAGFLKYAALPYSGAHSCRACGEIGYQNGYYNWQRKYVPPRDGDQSKDVYGYDHRAFIIMTCKQCGFVMHTRLCREPDGIKQADLDKIAGKSARECAP